MVQKKYVAIFTKKENHRASSVIVYNDMTEVSQSFSDPIIYPNNWFVRPKILCFLMVHTESIVL